MLEKLSLFRKRYFAEGSAPAISTLRKHVDLGLLSGRVTAGSYFVETTAWGEPLFYHSSITTKEQTKVEPFMMASNKAQTLINQWAAGR